MRESAALALIYRELCHIFTSQVYLGGCDKPACPLVRRAAVTAKASTSVFIKTQGLSDFNYTDNSLSDTVTPRVDAIEKSLCWYIYSRPEDIQVGMRQLGAGMIMPVLQF